MNHEDGAAQLHADLHERAGSVGGVTGTDHQRSVDMTGAALPTLTEKSVAPVTDTELQETSEGQEPNEHEKQTLRRVGDHFPASAYLIAVVELCERFTCRSRRYAPRACLAVG